MTPALRLPAARSAFWTIAIAALTVELVAVVALLCRPWLTGCLIDRAMHSGLQLWPAAGLLATWLLRAVLGDVRESLVAGACAHAASGLRGRLLAHVFATRGQEPDRLADGQRFAEQAPRLALDTWSSLLRMGIGAGMLALVHRDLMVAVLPAALLCVILGWHGRGTRAAAHRVAAARAAERSRWHEILAARNAWTPPGWLTWMTADVAGRAAERARQELRTAWATGWWQPAMAGAVALGVVLVLLAGSGQVARGDITPGGLASGIFLVFLTIGPLLDIAASGDRWVCTWAAWSRLRHVPATETPTSGGRLAWSQLSVTWPDGGTINLPAGEIPPGGRLLIGGRSGAGKSTLLCCLAGRRRPSSGSITGGKRSVLLLHDSALPPWPVETFLSSVGPSTPVAVRQAIAELGLTSVVGDVSVRADLLRGTAAGQAVALTAAYLSAAPMLLLDEALAAVEPVLAARAIDHLLATGRCVVLATHRREACADWPVLEITGP